MTIFLIIAVSFLFAVAIAQSPESVNPKIPPAIMTGAGFFIGMLVYATTFLVTMACVPRLSEGGRRVVDLPWPLYVTLPAVLAFVCLAALGFLVSKRNWNSLFIIGFNVAIAASTWVGSGLLRRDYIGKF